jgi:hypothetical protein
MSDACWSGLDGLSLGLEASYSKTGSNQASAQTNSGSYMFSVSKSFNTKTTGPGLPNSFEYGGVILWAYAPCRFLLSLANDNADD